MDFIFRDFCVLTLASDFYGLFGFRFCLFMFLDLCFYLKTKRNVVSDCPGKMEKVLIHINDASDITPFSRDYMVHLI